ncbi:MAG: ABC transporter permease [Bdellovibrionales bacterium]
MFQFIRHRLLSLIPVLLIVSTAVFFLLHLVPGDPVDIILGDNVTAVQRQELRAQLGLDQPILVQYKNYMLGLIQGDLGESIYRRQPIGPLILKSLPATLELSFGALVFAMIMGLPLGVLTAVKRGGPLDWAISTWSLLGMSLPAYFLGPMLIWGFAIHWDLLPVSERGDISHLVLPSLSLAIPLGSVLIRMTRASVIEVMNEDYIRTAQAKGLSQLAMYFKHALKNAMIPILTTLGLQLGALLTGTVITETIFDWPGIGTLLFNSIQQRDYPLVQGCILFVAVIYLLVNLLTDLAYAFVNPKVRLQ